MIETRCADWDQHVGRADRAPAGAAEHDCGEVARRLDAAEAGEPEKGIDPASVQHGVGSVAPGIVVGGTRGEARAQRHAGLPGADLIDPDDVVRTGEREAHGARRAVEGPQDGGEPAHQKVGMRPRQLASRPDDEAIGARMEAGGQGGDGLRRQTGDRRQDVAMPVDAGLKGGERQRHGLVTAGKVLDLVTFRCLRP
jgi:hypothetical protein